MSDEFAYACKLLSRREYSEGEMRRKLDTKWPESEKVEETLELLLRENMLSDERYCTAFIRSRVSRFQGPRKIRAELSRRQLADALVDQAMSESGVDWRDLAGEWLAKQNMDAGDYEVRAKYYRRLMNRGFNHDQAMDALNRQSEGENGV